MNKKHIRSLIKKFLVVIVILLGITFLSYCLIYLSPSDPAQMLYDSQGIVPTKEMLEATRARMGLDQPMLVQYGRWLLGFFTGDLGSSLKSGNPVLSELIKVLPNTLILTVIAMIIAVGFSIPTGVLCARYQDGILDRIVRVITYGFASMPSFFLSLVMMYIFCVKLHLFPVISSAGGKGVSLPALVLGITNAAWFTRQVRAIVVREQNNDYVLGLRSRGVGEMSIMFRHVLKNSLLPVLTLIGVSFGSLLGGATIVESIFSWPGLGKQAIDSIGFRDYPMIQGYVVWMALIFLFINALVDYSYKNLDPRVKHGSERGKSK